MYLLYLEKIRVQFVQFFDVVACVDFVLLDNDCPHQLMLLRVIALSKSLIHTFIFFESPPFVMKMNKHALGVSFIIGFLLLACSGTEPNYSVVTASYCHFYSHLIFFSYIFTH